jgi:hypothetical protein
METTMTHAAEEKFRKGDKIKTIYGTVETVTHVVHPMVYTKEHPETAPGGGYNYRKVSH